MSHPKKDNPKRRKNNRIPLYFNDEEKKLFLKMMSLSRHKYAGPFIREILFEGKFQITYRDKTREEQIYSLAKIGTNINQIAHRLNIDNAPRLNEKDHQVLEELRKLLLQIKF